VKLYRLNDREITPKAQELVDFDMDSIRQIAASEKLRAPQLWLANPDQYESTGRILRDSPSPRMLAYAAERNVLLVTDGCNSCAHFLKGDLKEMDGEALKIFSTESHIAPQLLDRMIAILKNLSIN
jgi:hypothetical protein